MSDFATLAEMIAEFKAGRPVIIVDDEARENEGDLVMPADMITPDIITFMAKECSGLICLTMDLEMADRLGLKLIGKRDNKYFDTAFLMPIEAKEGVTTGISAADRAHTIKVAVNPESTPSHLATPGHVFPILAHKDGLAGRQGHTEASVELAHKAGCSNAAVICEIMKEDGTMARLPDLQAFARHWSLKIGTIDSMLASSDKEAA